MFLRDDLGADFARVAIRNPIEFCDQIRGSHIGRRVAVALEAHAHIERLLLTDFDHLVYAAMATYAAHAC